MKQATSIVVFVFVLLPTIAFAQGIEVVLEIEGMDDVTIQNIEYRNVDGEPFTMDVYYPPDLEEGVQLPVVIFVNGFRDSRLAPMIDTDLKDTPLYTSWGRLVAASGLIAVNYESEQADDLTVLVGYIRDNAESLQIDGERIGLWASSSNPPTAIAYAMQEDHAHIKAVVFYYGSLVTPDGEFTSAIDGECHQYGCYGPSELAPVEQLRDDLPTLIVRVGFDNGENEMIDHYLIQALESEVPLTFINFPDGLHGFDGIPIERALHQSQSIVAETLDFLIFNLSSE